MAQLVAGAGSAHAGRERTMLLIGISLDFLMVLIFVAIGRSAHEHGESIRGLASTTWPFAVGLAIAWFLALVSHRVPSRPTVGAGITMVTVTCGMVLRVLAGQGTAFAFVMVALGFLGGEMALWRGVQLLLERDHQRARG